jgi:hypothetical protein
VLARLLAEHAPQARDRLVEVVLLDDDVRPQGLEQLLLREQLARVFDEVQQREGHSHPACARRRV